jgi:hypothetical protein
MNGGYFLLRTKEKVKAEASLLFLGYNMKRTRTVLGATKMMVMMDEWAALSAVVKCFVLLLARIIGCYGSGCRFKYAAATCKISHSLPFLSDLFLLLDRMADNDEEFVCSIHDELFDVLRRRGVEQIEIQRNFDPSVHKAVRAEYMDTVEKTEIIKVVRNGYVFAGKVIRPAEVIVVVPGSSSEGINDDPL